MQYLYNGQPGDFSEIQTMDWENFQFTTKERICQGARVASLFGLPEDDEQIALVIVLANDANGNLEIIKTPVSEEYPSLTPEIPQVHWFEREIFEQWGIKPIGHPWLKPIRFHQPYRSNSRSNGGLTEIKAGITDYYEIRGEEIHEVAVGPVHAGIIEPGHFRFQCHGENVLHLEIELGYQYRGIEQQLWQGINKKSIHYMETLAGDTTIGHATAYAMNIEALTGNVPSHNSQMFRTMALELERLANHTGDIGAIAGDIGFLPTASYCGKIRGDFLNLTALLCGNRFGRGIITPGGVNYGLTDSIKNTIEMRLSEIYERLQEAVNLMWDTPSVMARLEGTGILARQDALKLGVVGPAARASDVRRDVRCDYPWGGYMTMPSPTLTMKQGDVYSRTSMRWFEIQNSIEIILSALNMTGKNDLKQNIGPLDPDKIVVSMVEGWRGELCHVAITSHTGLLRHYKITDPSFHNWFGLAYAMRNQQISDFPLCNKSFNLSYCGHDL